MKKKADYFFCHFFAGNTAAALISPQQKGKRKNILILKL